jgi:SAM-dependent methyltransferase
MSRCDVCTRAGCGTLASVTADREYLRATFNTAADRYQQVRPGYPEELFDHVLTTAGLQPGAYLLEVGCATGKATLPLAKRGYRITCVELGTDLAAAATRNLAGFPGVHVIQANFETWQPQPPQSFDLIYAATAWHWIDPEVRYRRAWELLRAAGHLALWSASHVVPDDGDTFFAELQPVYDEIGEGLPSGWFFPRPGELPDGREETEASGLFDTVSVRHFDWEVRYTAEQYIALLSTFSGHMAMQGWQRDRLSAEIRRRLAARPDGMLRRHWGAAVLVARRRDVPGFHDRGGFQPALSQNPPQS